MPINTQKLRVMLEEHKSRGGELERLINIWKDKLEFPLEKEDFRSFMNQYVIPFYRHTGAIMVLEGILNGKDYDWNTGKNESPTGSGDG